MVRLVGQRDPETARAALDGLTAYQRAPRPYERPERPVAATAGPAVLRDHGGKGPPAVLVPSLINPPHVLDLDAEVSLASAVAAMDRRALLLDWGPARERSPLDVAGHVEELLVPLLSGLGEPAALVGYCLGGTMALAAANIAPVERLATLAAPWHFSSYPAESRSALLALWRQVAPAAAALDVLPMEVLQAAFWSLDPERTVSKFAKFAAVGADSPRARRFVALEEWANEGEPLPLAAARELVEDFFGADLPGSGSWRVAGRAMSERPPVPVLHCTAASDRITPAATAPAEERHQLAAGHVGMVVGSARAELHRILRSFLDPGCRRPI